MMILINENVQNQLNTKAPGVSYPNMVKIPKESKFLKSLKNVL